MIEKFDLSLMEDLIYITDSIKQLLLQNQMKAINRMSDNVFAIKIYKIRIE